MSGRKRLSTPSSASTRLKSLPLDRNRHEHLGWLLSRADLLFAKRVTESLHAQGFVGVRLVHVALIRNVDEGGTRIGDIARRAWMTKQAAGQLVDEFRELGFIRVVPDPDDRRAKIAKYTAKGKRLLDAVLASIRETEAAFAAVIGTDEAMHLRAVLTELLAAEEHAT
jgi:DNA-binding MarR family transcriptional regulator